MRSQRHVAVPAVKARVAPGRRMINHRHRLHRQRPGQVGVQEALKQRRLEGQDAAAVRAGAFGKEQQPVAGTGAGAELLRLGLRQARVASNEMRLGHAGQDVDAGPARHLGLGNEEHRHGRVHHEDVQPAGMVRDHRARAPHRPPPNLAAQAHEPQADAADDLDMGARHRVARTGQQPFPRAQGQDQPDPDQQDRQDRQAPRRDQKPAQGTGPGNRGGAVVAPGAGMGLGHSVRPRAS